VSVDVNAFIDAIPIIAVVACYAEGETHIYNGAIAKHKECDRLQSTARELSKLGAVVVATDDGLRIQGAPLLGNQVYSCHDHRLAMSLAVAALGAEGPSHIQAVECIAKTFPDFIGSFQQLNADIQQCKGPHG
jgi:3-phosphoshikimate 1-carboxyvinyltransferase